MKEDIYIFDLFFIIIMYMSLIALKRKYEAIKKNTGGTNRATVAPGSYLARKNVTGIRSENKTYFITPDVASSDHTQKIKSDALYREENCGTSEPASSCSNRISGAPINISKKVCNVKRELTVEKSSDYIENLKKGCTRVEMLPRIPGSC
jgi:DNA polymerase sigma